MSLISPPLLLLRLVWLMFLMLRVALGLVLRVFVPLLGQVGVRLVPFVLHVSLPPCSVVEPVDEECSGSCTVLAGSDFCQCDIALELELFSIL